MSLTELRVAPAIEDPASAAEQVVSQVLADLGRTGHPAVVVDAPPGAGKSTLVVRAALHLVEAGERLMIVAQTNEQVEDLIVRLAAEDPELRIGRLCAADYRPADRIAKLAGVLVAAKAEALEDRPVTVATAAKWATVSAGHWPWAIVDEAYQMRSDTLLGIAERFGRALFVGDPGQLDPFATAEDRSAGPSWDPMLSAVAVLLAHNDLPVHRLPVSWRLSASAAPLVSEAFYPFTGFRSGTEPGERRLEFSAAGMGTTYDRALDEAAASGWALYELPAKHTARTDAEAIEAIGALAVRVLQRGAIAYSEYGEVPVDASRIAVGAAHRDQVVAIQSVLSGTGIAVDTANRLQGREYDVTFVLHPLSGRRDATDFHLQSGRLCVLTSRHRQACVVVARAGIPELLDAHPSTEPVHLDGPVKFPDGWVANHTILDHLARFRIPSGRI